MATKLILDLINEVFATGNITPEQLSQFESSLKENQEKCISQSNQSLVLFLTTVTTWFLIRSASISKVNILDIELTDLQIPLLLLPIVAAFSFYSHQSSFGFAGLIDVVLERIREEKYKGFAAKNLEMLLAPPSIGFIENSVEQIELQVGKSSKTNILWLVLIFITLTVIPIFVLLYICLELVLHPVYGTFFTVISVILTALLTLRSLLILIKTFKLF